MVSLGATELVTVTATDLSTSIFSFFGAWQSVVKEFEFRFYGMTFFLISFVLELLVSSSKCSCYSRDICVTLNSLMVSSFVDPILILPLLKPIWESS